MSDVIVPRWFWVVAVLAVVWNATDANATAVWAGLIASILLLLRHSKWSTEAGWLC